MGRWTFLHPFFIRISKSVVHSRTKIRLFHCNTWMGRVPQGKLQNETSSQLVRGGAASASARAKGERSTLHSVRVVFAGFPNLSVCRLPIEIWVCLRAKRNENGGKESVRTQPVRNILFLTISLFLHQQHQFFPSLMKTDFIKDIVVRLRDGVTSLKTKLLFQPDISFFLLSLHIIVLTYGKDKDSCSENR